MPTFQFDQSSTPTTPSSTPRPKSKLFGEHPSTTPAGPPTETAKSFLSGNAPSITFPSAKTNTQKNAQAGESSMFADLRQPTAQIQKQSTKIPLNEYNTDDFDHYDDADADADADGDMDFDQPQLPYQDPAFDDVYDWEAHADSTRRESVAQRLNTSNRALDNDGGQFSTAMVRSRESALAAATRNLLHSLGEPELIESDELILQTEFQVDKMYNEHVSIEEQEEILSKALKIIPEALCRVWRECSNRLDHSTDEERGDSIGPLEDDPALYKAAFVGEFMLLLNHPPARIFQPSQFNTSTNSRALAVATVEAYPKILVEWLDRNHNPYRSAVPRVQRQQPNPTASNNFWDLVMSCVLRGQLKPAVEFLANADFKYAASALEDGYKTRGYQDSQLQMAGIAVGRAAARLQSCPALQNGDWNVTNGTWATWRLGVEEEAAELVSMAEGDDQAAEFRTSFQAENFGLSIRPQPLSKSTRRATSKVPWTVYQNLKMLYNILLGASKDIRLCAQDWLEATLSLAIWWNGSDQQDLSASMPHRQSRRKQTRNRMVDVDVVKAYRQRLMDALEAVTYEDALQMEDQNAVQVALASVIEGNFQDAFTILRPWSIPITSALMEIGTEAQWYDSVHTEPAPDIFDESDLMVLSYARPEPSISKDSVLVEYAKMLLDREPLNHDGNVIEGWELAVELVGRIDNTNTGIRTVQEIIRSIPVVDDKKADRVISICNQFDLYKEATDIAEKYADTIPETTGYYGTALVYYARAHNEKKVKDVLDLLISYCLVQSCAFPAPAELDNHLADLLEKPRDSLAALAAEDTKAAEILSSQFSGYATIRKFYDIRDEGLGSGSRPMSLSRRKAAAGALLTIIQSSADNVQGGLYDNDSLAIIPVDGLLALLGEASIFVNQKPRVLALKQVMILLRVIEDLNAVHPRIKAQCLEFFSSTLAAGHGKAQPDPRELMKKGVSDLTASSGFTQSTGFYLLGESMMGSGIGSSYADIGADNSKDSKKRAWDWRQNYKKDTLPGRLIKKLRLGLAEEVATAWIDGK